MRNLKNGFSSSLVSTINAALVSIIALGLLTIFSLMWATDQTDQDAQAINLSGSIRMQTYRVGLATAQQQSSQAEQYMQQLDEIWQNPLFIHQRRGSDTDLLSQDFMRAERHWREVLRPQLEALVTSPLAAAPLAPAATAARAATATATATRAAPQQGRFPTEQIAEQLVLTEKLVNGFQQAAESKIRLLRIIQLAALFLTIALGAVIFNLLKTRLEKPLAQLTDAASRIGQGDYGYQTQVEGNDELALLGSVVNRMSHSV